MWSNHWGQAASRLPETMRKQIKETMSQPIDQADAMEASAAWQAKRSRANAATGRWNGASTGVE